MAEVTSLKTIGRSGRRATGRRTSTIIYDGLVGAWELRQLHPGQRAVVQGPWSFVQVDRITEFWSLTTIKKLYDPLPGVRN